MSKVNPSKNTSRRNIFKNPSYEQFQLELVRELENEFDDNIKIELRKVMKNNSIEISTLVIIEDGSQVCPNMYLDLFYDLYIQGFKIREIAEVIIDLYYDYIEEEMKTINILDFSWDSVKDGVFYRIVNRKKNLKLLETVPHLLYLDLAIVFYYIATDSDSEIGIIRITKEHIKEWGIKLKDLRDTAIVNTPRLFPPKIRNMNDIILDLLNKDWVKDNGIDDSWKHSNNLTDDVLAEMAIATEKDDNQMYVLTNSKGIGGATCLLYKEALYEFAHELNSNLFILPSSIHEVIIVKDDGYTEKTDLRDLVKGVNNTDVAEEDFLSNQVYYYNRFKNIITM